MRGTVENAQVVHQPINIGAGGEHYGLDAPGEGTVAAPGHDREDALSGAVASVRGVAVGAHVQHSAGAKRDFRLTGAYAALPDEAALLVADKRREGW